MTKHFGVFFDSQLQ